MTPVSCCLCPRTLSCKPVPQGKGQLYNCSRDAQPSQPSLSSSKLLLHTNRNMPWPGVSDWSPRHLTEVSEEGPCGVPQAHLLDILLHSAVRGMQDGPHHFHVATDNQGFVRCVCVYSYSTVTDDGFWNLSSLPQCITVIFKLPRVRSLGKQSGMPHS